MSTEVESDYHKFEHLADSLPQMIWTARPDGYLDYYNERWYQFTQTTRGEGGDQSWAPLLHPDDLKRATEAWYHSVNTGEDYNLELRWLDRRINTYVWHLCIARPARNAEGKIIKWYGSCTDIDKQKKTEQQLVDILEGLNDSFFAIDANWNLSRVNSRMEATTNIRREEAVGKNFFLSFPMEKDSKYWINHHKIMEERVPVRYEEYYAPLDLWTEARGYPTADGGIAYLFRDISVEKKAQQKLEILTQELQEAVRVRDEFLSIASHELRTPVTSLKLQLQMLQRSMDPAKVLPPLEQLAKRVDTANAQVDRLTNLIEGLLDVTRLDAGKMTYQFQKVDLSALMNEVVERFSINIIVPDQTLRTKIKPGLMVECDPIRIEQVLENLISNALKYGQNKDVWVHLDGNKEGVTLAVQDTGAGIPFDKQEQIFNRFERLAPTRNIGGLGLGLYIAKQIVDGHHGKIGVESEVNVGSRFYVFLPFKQ